MDRTLAVRRIRRRGLASHPGCQTQDLLLATWFRCTGRIDSWGFQSFQAKASGAILCRSTGVVSSSRVRSIEVVTQVQIGRPRGCIKKRLQDGTLGALVSQMVLAPGSFHPNPAQSAAMMAANSLTSVTHCGAGKFRAMATIRARRHLFWNAISDCLGCCLRHPVRMRWKWPIFCFPRGRDRTLCARPSRFLPRQCLCPARLKPQFIDIRPDTLNSMSANWKTDHSQTVAVTPVHYAGVPCEMDPILRWQKRKGARPWRCRQALAPATGGAKRHHGCAQCFSFHETKNCVCGEGALAIRDPQFINRRKL